jgi:hypothetical protein
MLNETVWSERSDAGNQSDKQGTTDTLINQALSKSRRKRLEECVDGGRPSLLNLKDGRRSRKWQFLELPSPRRRRAGKKIDRMPDLEGDKNVA